MMTVQTNASQTQPIDCQIDFLSRQVAAAEEARRHAQTVSSELVQEKRALEQKLTEATARINWLTTYYDLSSVAYDNACLRAKEAAALLKVSERTVVRLPITRTRIGGQVRYDLADVEAYVQSRKVGGMAQMVPTFRVPTGQAIVNGQPVTMPTVMAQLAVKHRSPLFAIGGKR